LEIRVPEIVRMRKDGKSQPQCSLLKALAFRKLFHPSGRQRCHRRIAGFFEGAIELDGIIYNRPL
jgi:hypothetical protein